MAVENRPDDHTLVMTHELAAPRTLVFDAWTKAEHLCQWFAPDNFTCDCDLDFKVGGALRIRMVGYGMDNTVRGVYREIVAPERLVLAMRFDDMPELEMIQTITFAERGQGTLLTMRQELPAWSQIPASYHEALKFRWRGASIGWGQTLQHLADFVAKRR